MDRHVIGQKETLTTAETKLCVALSGSQIGPYMPDILIDQT